MEPKRLQEIIKPLEALLESYDFSIDGEPLIDGTVLMASFIKPDGRHVDYTLDVLRDSISAGGGNYEEYQLSVFFYDDYGPHKLFDYYCSTNRSIIRSVELQVEYTIGPELQKYL